MQRLKFRSAVLAILLTLLSVAYLPNAYADPGPGGDDNGPMNNGPEGGPR